MFKSFILSFILAINLVLSPVAFAAECAICDAVENGNLSEVKKLLDNGVNLEDKRARYDVLIGMINSKNKEDSDRAINMGREALRAQGIDPKSATVEEKLAALKADSTDYLYNAFEADEGLIAKLLIMKGANVNLANNGGWTALIYAARKGRAEIVKLLIEKGANLDLADKRGKTALIYAAQEGHTEIVKLLIEKGANPNLVSKSHKTALYYAVKESDFHLAKPLLKNGADINIRDAEGFTALGLAKEIGHPPMIEILEEYDNCWIFVRNECLWRIAR